ncbi:MAG: hypothetical protein L0Z50_09275 [Verrucomicrobiales bacterium]|nr:hypothetical protein [Verrucomicrobiales bacterium]
MPGNQLESWDKVIGQAVLGANGLRRGACARLGQEEGFLFADGTPASFGAQAFAHVPDGDSSAVLWALGFVFLAHMRGKAEGCPRRPSGNQPRPLLSREY